MNYVDVTDSAEASIWSDSPSALWGMWKSIVFHDLLGANARCHCRLSKEDRNLKQPSKLFVTVQSAAL
jgi:hypothetical protein